MNDIDFLPAEYHQRQAYRHSKPWQIIVVTSFLGLVALVTISQNIHRRMVENELGDLAPAYEMALSQQRQLAGVQKQLKQMEIEARLVTYLRHPWPRSRLLSALSSRLPQEITLQQLQVIREAQQQTAAPISRPGTIIENPAEQQKSLPQAQLDLNALHNQCEGKQTVVILIGTTTDSNALHRFLDEILTNSLFSKVELGSVTTESDRPATAIQFHAKLFVKPGYGQFDRPKEEQIDTSPQSLQNNSFITPALLNKFASHSTKN